MTSRMRARPLAAALTVAALAAASLAGGASAQQDRTQAEIERYREMLKDGNPAELVSAKGEVLWKTRRGPKNASLEQCDLGKGPGVVKDAYAELPRHFADTDQVMDFESRLVHCMVTLQGMDRDQLTRAPFSGEGQPATDLETLTAYVVEESRGTTISVPQKHPKEVAAFRRGEKMFYFRGGTHDFACATCHAEDAKRIRLQDLPNLTQTLGAQKAYTTWPAYRVSQGELRSFQWRLNDCFRQQRFPELVFGSDASIALTMFLAHNANGAAFDAPAIKR